MGDRWHYVYYSYEEWGRGYIGKRSSTVPPEKDPYLGSFSDPTFNPNSKIILATFDTSAQALEAEVALHAFYCVDKNPHFANKAKQTSTRFAWSGDLTKILGPKQERSRRSKISAAQRSGSRGFFYHLISPSGLTHVTINLTEFCRDHNLNRQNIEKVASGARRHHKGWKAKRIEAKQ